MKPKAFKLTHSATQESHVPVSSAFQVSAYAKKREFLCKTADLKYWRRKKRK